MADKYVNGVNVTELGKTIHQVRHDASLGEFRFRASNRWDDCGRSETAIESFYGAGQENSSPARPFKLVTDEPPVLLGNDAGPNPVEYLLNALVTCLTNSMVYHAAAGGMRIDRINSEIEGDLDIRGFLGVSDEVRKGYQNIRVKFRVEGEPSEDQLRAYCGFSPVYDVVSRGTNVDIEIEAVQPERRAMAPEVTQLEGEQPAL